MKNSPGPLYMVLHYGDGTHQHAMELPLSMLASDPPPSVGVAPELSSVVRGGSTQESDAFSVWSAALFAALKAALPSAQALGSYDIWYKSTPTGKPQWVYGGAVANGSGASSGSPQIAVVATFSFRTNKGGKFRSCFCDTNLTNDNRFEFAGLNNGGNAAFEPWVTYLLGVNSRVVGRDGGRISSMISCTTKENDKLRRRKMNG